MSKHIPSFRFGDSRSFSSSSSSFCISFSSSILPKFSILFLKLFLFFFGGFFLSLFSNSSFCLLPSSFSFLRQHPYIHEKNFSDSFFFVSAATCAASVPSSSFSSSSSSSDVCRREDVDFCGYSNIWFSDFSLKFSSERKKEEASLKFAKRKADFLYRFPDYDDSIRVLAEKELGRFREQVYMDYAGSGVYQGSQIKNIYEDQLTHAYGNAHSRNPSADLTDQRISEARSLLMKFFDAPTSLYSIIFTSGATGALKLMGEDFPWGVGSSFYYLRSNHNSVLGIREYAVKGGGGFRAVSVAEVNSILAERQTLYEKGDDDVEVADELAMGMKKSNAGPFCLFAFPAKDNFSGMYYPLGWIERIQKYGLSSGCKWRVLLDAAAFVPTNSLSLSKFPADYTVVSFYKMFGSPTGLGALLLRSSDAEIFNEVYFGGGTVVSASCNSHWCRRKSDPSSRFEDGTVSFLAIVAVRFGIQKLKEIGMEKINNHVAILTKYIASELDNIRHLNGKPVVLRYYEGRELPTGGIIAFNVFNFDQQVVDFSKVEVKAMENGIHLRTGCFCNPGSCQDFLGLTDEEFREITRARESCSDPSKLSRTKAIGAVRVSLGYLSTFEDADNFLQFIRLFV